MALSIADNVALPTDTEASIVSDGLLGGKYVQPDPRARQRQDQGRAGVVTHTRDYQSLEDLVGQIIFLATSSGNSAHA